MNARRPIFFSQLNLFIAFSIAISLETVLCSLYPATSMSMLITHYKYLIPLFAMYLYVDGDERKLRKILWAITISIDLLCIGSFVSPVISKTGAISVGTLNVNVFSSFLMLGLFSEIALILRQDEPMIKRIFLILSILLSFIVQVNTASRRGFLVFCFILAFVAWQFVRLEFRGKPIVKVFFVIMLIIGAFLIYISFMEQFGDTALMKRLLGGSNDTSEGDRLRLYFQATALQLFLYNPLTGAGLNSVAVVAGMYSHSLYFELLGCTGLIGFGLIIGYLLRTLLIFSRYIKKSYTLHDKNTMFLSLCGVTLILAVFICGYAVVMIYDMYFYIIIAILASTRSVIKKNIMGGNHD